MAYTDFQLKHEVVKVKKASTKVLLLVFLNTSVWLGGSFLFIHLEGSTEAEHKCGVKRVQRDFIDLLWSESQGQEEGEWKSLARHKLAVFEEQLHDAVEAGVSSYSGRKVWSLSNAMVYCFSLATTVGYGHLTPASTGVKLVSLAYGFVSCPLLALLISQLGCLLSSLLTLVALLLCYTLAGGVLFSSLFPWPLSSSLYFLLSTFSTVGFGDMVPEDSVVFLMSGGYILLGLALYSLWQGSAAASIDAMLERYLVRLAVREVEKIHQQ